MRPNRYRCIPRLEALEDRLAPATFTVTNTDDSGAGSLRQAITDANNTANTGGPDRIEFNITGAGVHTIRPDVKLPDIIDPVIIDGYTQPGASPNTLAVGNDAVLLIEINGDIAGETNGIIVNTSDSTIRGLVVNGFRAGPTTGRGIVVRGVNNADNVIVGNFLGVNPAGTAAVPNERDGIFVIEANRTRIGGPDPADRNVSSGNKAEGLFVNAPNTVIQNNYFGVNAAGTAAIPNLFDGVFLAADTGYLLGGPAPSEGNVIAGNRFTGLVLNFVTNSVIQGNMIGVAADGVTPLGNGNEGVLIINLAGPNTNNLFGGPAAGAANTIAFNGNNGILVQDNQAAGNRFQANSIFENGLLGIDLGNDGVTANDAGDADAGANGLQNKPVLTSAPFSTGATPVNGSLNSVANENYRIELFSVPIADATGGEGRTFIGATEVSTDATGNATFQVILNVPEGTVISSTATRLSTLDTSEFSNNVTASTQQGGTVSGTVFRDLNGDSVRQGNEPGLGGALVFLDANDNGVLDGESATVSAADGSYTLTSLLDGTFKVTSPAQSGTPASVDLVAGATVTGVDVGVLSANQAFVERLFQTILGRTADGAGLAAFAAALDAGASRQSVADAIIHSAEARLRAIDRVFADLLNRAVDPAGQSGFFAFLSGGGTEEGVRAAVLASPEYLALAGGTNEGFVDALFQDVLGRTPDPAGRAVFESLLGQGVGRDTVARIVLGSAESNLREIAALFVALLDRAPDPTGQSGFAAFLASGGSNEQATALIASSPEFAQLALA